MPERRIRRDRIGRAAGDVVRGRAQIYLLDPGSDFLPLIVERWAHGARAAVVFTDHADRTDPEALRAVLYGVSDRTGSGRVVANQGAVPLPGLTIAVPAEVELDVDGARQGGMVREPGRTALWFDLPPGGQVVVVLPSGTLAMGGYLRLLAVAPGAERHGLGSALLAAFEEASARWSGHAYLLISDFNSRAQRFYERHGYQHVGRLPGLVLPDVDELLYLRRLTRR